MFLPNKTDKLIFVNIKNSYEALQRNDTNNPLYRDSLYECDYSALNVPLVTV